MVKEAPKSSIRLDFEESARKKNWRQAFRDFNAMSMYEMLRSYRDLGAGARREFWSARNNTTNFPGAGCNPAKNVPNVNPGELPRMKYAVDVVDAMQMPDGDPPGDLRDTGQEEDAREFLAPAPDGLAGKRFTTFLSDYPQGSVEEVKRRIGGHIAMDGTITNTCSIRLSRVLNRNGFEIPGRLPGLTTQTGDDGMWYSRYQKQLTAWLEGRLGAPSLELRKPVDRRKLFNLQGIIGFDIRSWADATGHIDLWDGKKFGTEPQATHDYFALAEGVKFWRVPNWSRSPGP